VDDEQADPSVDETQPPVEELTTVLRGLKVKGRHPDVERHSETTHKQPTLVQGIPVPQMPLELAAIHEKTETTDEVPGADASVNEVKAAGSSVDSQPVSQAAPIAFSVNIQKQGVAEQSTVERTNPSATNAHSIDPSSSNDAAQSSETASGGSGSDSSRDGERSTKAPKLESPKLAKEAYTSAARESVQTVTGHTGTSTDSASGASSSRAVERSAPLSKPTAVAEPELAAAPSAPRHIDLRVTNEHGHPVDVRVSQRDGDVQMTVRTLDGDLSQSLRKHLPELSANLTQTGMKGEFLHAGINQSSDTQHNGSQQQGRQNQSEQQQSDNPTPSRKNRDGNNGSASFAEFISTEKGNR
jgi:hypothetical protein